MRSALCALLTISSGAAGAQSARTDALSSASTAREVAITFDDLPAIPASMSIARQQRLTRDLLRSIRAAKVPAVGFVNEDKLTTNLAEIRE